MALPAGVVERNKDFFLTGGPKDIDLGRVQGPWGDRDSFKVDCSVRFVTLELRRALRLYFILSLGGSRPPQTPGERDHRGAAPQTPAGVWGATPEDYPRRGAWGRRAPPGRN